MCSVTPTYYLWRIRRREDDFRNAGVARLPFLKRAQRVVLQMTAPQPKHRSVCHHADGAGTRPLHDVLNGSHHPAKCVTSALTTRECKIRHVFVQCVINQFFVLLIRGKHGKTVHDAEIDFGQAVILENGACSLFVRNGCRCLPGPLEWTGDDVRYRLRLKPGCKTLRLFKPERMQGGIPPANKSICQVIRRHGVSDKKQMIQQTSPSPDIRCL